MWKTYTAVQRIQEQLLKARALDFACAITREMYRLHTNDMTKHDTISPRYNDEKMKILDLLPSHLCLDNMVNFRFYHIKKK